MATSLESQVQINVYLKEDLSEQKMEDIGQKIKKLSGVEEIKFISKKEAMERFKERLGDQQTLLTALGNPIHCQMLLKLNSERQNK